VRFFALILCAAAVLGQQQPPASGKKTAVKKASSKKTSSKKASSRQASTKPAATKAATTKTASSTSSKSKSGKSKRTAVVRRAVQQQPTAERYKEIQEALAAKGYFHGTADGSWGADSVDALKRFQREQNLEEDGKIGSLSLIALGLGPKRAASPAPEKPPVP
jgi:peptidoglycan hydrolase-like protein with peptidoglycan-binding domain